MTPECAHNCTIAYLQPSLRSRCTILQIYLCTETRKGAATNTNTYRESGISISPPSQLINLNHRHAAPVDAPKQARQSHRTCRKPPRALAPPEVRTMRGVGCSGGGVSGGEVRGWGVWGGDMHCFVQNRGKSQCQRVMHLL